MALETFQVIDDVQKPMDFRNEEMGTKNVLQSFNSQPEVLLRITKVVLWDRLNGK